MSAVIEMSPGAEDDTVIERAARERRIVVTEDRDFGQLVYAAENPTVGVIMLRFPSNARAHLPPIVVQMVEHYGEKLTERFIVVEPGRIRLGLIANE